MLRLWSHAWWSDARHYQIAALATLLVFNLARLDFGAQPQAEIERRMEVSGQTLRDGK